MAYSLLIKNGTLIDGSGREPYPADVGIFGNKITAVGNLTGEDADEIIDASNLYVTPGFIDLTNHSDVYGTIFAVPEQTSMLMQGVTTALLGNCGESLAPIAGKESLDDLERWTNVPFNVNWNSVGEYYDQLDNIGIGLNLMTLVGQETLRRAAPVHEERMLLLERAMAEGAWGMSSNFSLTPRDGKEEFEILDFLKIIKNYDGLYKIHLRDEGKNFLPSISALINLVRASGVRAAISHFKAVGRGAWKEFDDALRIIRGARSDGVEIWFDVFPYLRTGSMLLSLLPDWSRNGTGSEILERLKNAAEAAKIIDDLKKMTLHPEKILIASAFYETSFIGKTLEEAAERMEISPEEAIVAILKSNKLNVNIFGRTISGKNMLASLKEEAAMLATDGAGYDIDFSKYGGLAHPRSFGAFPRFFGTLSKKAGVSLGQAVFKMTYLPATLLKFSDRGLIKQGYEADIAVFHPEEFRDSGTYKNPYCYSSGLRFLIIGGKAAVSEGTVISRHGKVIRKKT